MCSSDLFGESLGMLAEEEVGVRKVRARWRADIILDRGFGFVTVFLADGAMAGRDASKSDELLEICFCYLIRLLEVGASDARIFLGALPNAGPRSGSPVIRTLAVGRKMIYPFCDAQNSDRPAVENGLD